MGKSPGFWFFTGDWLKDTELRFCSIFARGLLVDLLCIMFEAKEQGFMSKPDGTPRSDADIVDAISGGTREEKLSALKELESSGVLSRDNRNVLYSRRLSKLKELSESRSKSGSKGGSKTQAKLKQNNKQNTEQKAGVTVTDSDTLVSEEVGESPLNIDRSQPSAPSNKKTKKPKVDLWVKPEDASQVAWDAWMEIRKKGGGINSEYAWHIIKTEAEKAGLTLAEVVERCARGRGGKGWVGFEAKYVESEKPVRCKPIDFNDETWRDRRPA